MESNKKEEKILKKAAELKKYGDDFLTTKLGTIQGTLRVLYIILGILALGCIILSGIEIINYGIKYAITVIPIYWVGFVAFCLILFFPMRSILMERKAILTEINRRTKNEKGNSAIEETVKKKSRRSFIVIIAIIVAVVIAIFGYLLFSMDSTNGNSGDKCKNCGRKTELVTGFNYCYDCYESFSEWQEENFKK